MPSYAIPAGIALLVLSLLVFYLNILWGILALLGGLVITFTKVGMEINKQNLMYRDFYDLFGIRYGEWSSYKGFTQVSYLRKTESTQADPQASWMLPVYSRTTFYDVYLLNSDRSRKRKIWRFLKAKEAADLVKKLSVKLELEIIQPTSPTRSRQRNRRR